MFMSGEWMIPVNQENLARSAASAADAATATAPEGERQEDTADDKQEPVVEVKGDPEMAPVFLRHLLPVFTQVFQSAMVQSVRYVSFFVSLLCEIELKSSCLQLSFSPCS